jgi:hypothetical protein
MLHMAGYRDDVRAAREQGLAAYEAMEAWVSRPLGAPDVPGALLEGYARELRTSRERLRELLAREGIRDDIEAALEENRTWHRSLGLSIRDVEAQPEEEDPLPDL